MSEKLLSVAVPCYNSQAYMEKCVDSLLAGGEEVEIIIVDDGSKDKTAAIADRYSKQYPTIVKAVHQENGGHGEAVNTGLANSTGHFFKVVDSDDWVDRDAYKKLLNIMRDSLNNDDKLDMLISNFVYDKQGAHHKKVMSYNNVLPKDRYFTWHDVGHFRVAQYILMHSVIYRTGLLRECGLKLPKHTFYVDNIFIFNPLPYVKKMYYTDVVFYHYFIGRDDQSVNESVMIKRIDQQLRVNRLMIDYFDYDAISERPCMKYMQNYVNIMMTISSAFCVLSKDEENYKKKHELWMYLKEKNPRLYKNIMHTFLGAALRWEGKVSRTVQRAGYRLFQKIIGFN